jgi:hypothetical protein
MSRNQIGASGAGRLRSNEDDVRRALNWLLTSGIFKELSFHGNTKWQPVQLVTLALLFVWSSKAALTDAFVDAQRWATLLFGKAALTTYQGLAGALVTWTPTLLPLLWDRIHRLLEANGGPHWRIGVWLALAVDGSRDDVPRTRANAARFCAKNFGHGQTAKYRKKKSKGMRRKRNRQSPAYPVKPQMWLTLLWHLGMRLPWSWKLGPSDSSERLHLTQMVREQTFPKNTLFCGDAGFVGYDFWQTIVEQKHNLLMRVGGNVRLLRNLCHIRQRDDIVYCWPSQAMRKKQPPLVLRLLKFRNRRKYIYLVTTVLNEKSLTGRVAEELYRRCWGIEVQFRALKQTFGRAKLRSRNPERALVEMQWSLLGVTIIQLWAMVEQHKASLLPEQLSEHPTPGNDLRASLRRAILDGYNRSSKKEARYKPKYNTKPSAGKPKVALATIQHKLHLRKHFEALAA